MFEREIGVSDSIVEALLVKSAKAGDPALHTAANTLEQRVSALGPDIVTSIASPYRCGPSSLIGKSGSLSCSL